MSRFKPSARTIARTVLIGIVASVTLTACGGTKGTISAGSATPAATTATGSVTPSSAAGAPSKEPEAPAVTTSKPATQKPGNGTKPVSSDVSALKRLGVDFNVGVLIDVADDGQDRYLAIGKGGVVDFTGTGKTDNTMMSLQPAKVSKHTEETKNRVVIAPPFYNEDLGAGSCVADTGPGVLRLATCDAGAANQTWQIFPAGDSGQFELHGVATEIRVDNGKLVSSGGYVGLQTIKFAG